MMDTLVQVCACLFALLQVPVQAVRTVLELEREQELLPEAHAQLTKLRASSTRDSKIKMSRDWRSSHAAGVVCAETWPPRLCAHLHDAKITKMDHQVMTAVDRVVSITHMHITCRTHSTGIITLSLLYYWYYTTRS